MAYYNKKQIADLTKSTIEDFNDFLKEMRPEYKEKHTKSGMFYDDDILDEYKEYYQDVNMKMNILSAIMGKRLM